MSEQRPGGLDPEEYKRLYRRQQKDSNVEVIMDTDEDEDWRSPEARARRAQQDERGQ